MENQMTTTVTKTPELMALEAKQAAEFALTPVGMMVRNMEAINQVATYYAKSDFVPANFKGRVENCAIAIDMATRMGMNPIMVMQQMYIVNGKPSISSQLIIALINNCGQFEPLKFEYNGKTGDEFGMRAWTVRKNDPETRLEGTWITQKMVKDSKWGSKWNEIPGQMYRYRAAVFWARINAPEITMGFYTCEEVEEPSFEVETIHDAAPAPKTPQQIALEKMKEEKIKKEKERVELPNDMKMEAPAPEAPQPETTTAQVEKSGEIEIFPDNLQDTPATPKQGRSLV